MGDARVKLLGSWASSYCHRVLLALRLKGVEFEYLEEDLSNKSPLLLLHNPVHKKVPVLLHDEKPVAESVVILEYIDETWKENPILPEAPHDRSVARFWVHFVEEKLGPAIGKVFQSAGEEQKAAAEQVSEYLKLVERELKEGRFKGRRFFGGETIGILDIVLGCGSYWLSVLEQVAGVNLIDVAAFPCFHAWLKEFESLAEVREAIPAQERLLEHARSVRQMMAMMTAPAWTKTEVPTAVSDEAAPVALTK
ncbi:Glutathione transferase GST 23 [Nymphaea thermarum]|nr:Glutathione transferase GST 23 [Nymphaea thermarum]